MSWLDLFRRSSKDGFRLAAEEIVDLGLENGNSYCFASDLITVKGLPVRFMYREQPDRENDSGWRFMSGLESDDYANDPAHTAIYAVNTIANYDRSVIQLLDSPPGSVFEKPDGSQDFRAVTDWSPTP